MVNLNGSIVKKIKDIEKKADHIIIKADKKAEGIITSARSDGPEVLKKSIDTLDQEKKDKINSSTFEFESESQKKIEDGKKDILEEQENKSFGIEKASEQALKLFIEKIENMRRL